MADFGRLITENIPRLRRYARALVRDRHLADDEAISEADLHAYVDHQLNPARRAEVELFLEQHPETAEKVRSCEQINRDLQQLYNGVIEEPVPERLDIAAAGLKKRRFPGLQIAAMAATLAIGASIGWVARDELQPVSSPRMVMVDDAFTAHVVYTPEVRHPVEVGAEEEEHLLGWLSKRLKTKIRAPRLSSIGYELLGGRLLASDGEPAAQFMYQDADGNRLTLFVRAAEPKQQDTAFRYARRDGIQGFYWVDENLGYALIGNVARPTISKAAHIVYEELNQ